jgi:hypothetical protein
MIKLLKKECFSLKSRDERGKEKTTFVLWIEREPAQYSRKK